MRAVGLGKRILCRQQSFSGRTVALTLSILLKCVGDCDGAIAEILTIHRFDGGVGCFKAGVVDERESLRVACVRITLYLWRSQDNTECRERIVQQFLINFRIKVSDENVCSNVKIFLMSRRLVHPKIFII